MCLLKFFHFELHHLADRPVLFFCQLHQPFSKVIPTNCAHLVQRKFVFRIILSKKILYLSLASAVKTCERGQHFDLVLQVPIYFKAERDDMFQMFWGHYFEEDLSEASILVLTRIQILIQAFCSHSKSNFGSTNAHTYLE